MMLTWVCLAGIEPLQEAGKRPRDAAVTRRGFSNQRSIRFAWNGDRCFFGLTTFLLILDPSVCLRHGAEPEAVHAAVINQLQKHFPVLASSRAPEISVVDRGSAFVKLSGNQTLIGAPLFFAKGAVCRRPEPPVVSWC